jgi:two-component system sensor histidine kinase YesM
MCDGRIVVLQEVEALGYVLAVVPLAEFLDDVTGVRNMFVFLSLGFAVVTIGLSVALARRITRPISQLSRAMRRIQDGDFSVRVEERGTREIVTLARSFNTMGAEIDALVRKVALEEREALRAELLALRLQINPHFLYNTLEVMRGIAYAHDAPEAAEIASSLSALLRYSTAMDGDTVPVHEELESLRHYLKIQKHRFGERFATRIRIEPEAADAPVPRFILQPLVENAFHHAIEKSTRRLLLRVHIYAKEGDLFVEVQDNGQGMSEEELAELRQSLERGMESQNTGIGLLNVHNRIRLSFGEGYGASITSAPEQGTQVVLRLPREPREDEAL